jgi:predicted HTH domain antitoxin
VEELQKISELQPELVEDALKNLWKNKPELHRAVVVNAYLDEKISLSKAAELLGMTRMELEREFKEKGIPLRHLTEPPGVRSILFDFCLILC